MKTTIRNKDGHYLASMGMKSVTSWNHTESNVMWQWNFSPDEYQKMVFGDRVTATITVLLLAQFGIDGIFTEAAK